MTKTLKEQPADVLIVASDVAELGQIRDALQQAKVKNRMHHVGDPLEARSYLRRAGPYLLAPRPDLVLLDASLPDNSAVDIITELKTDAQLKGIPVIVLVGSESESRLIEDCLCTVDGTIQKPFDLSELVKTLAPLEIFSDFLMQPATAL